MLLLAKVQETKTNGEEKQCRMRTMRSQQTLIADWRMNVNCALGRRLCTELSTDGESASRPKPPSGATPDRHPATCIVPKQTKTPNGEIRLHIALADPFPRMQSSESVLRTTSVNENRKYGPIKITNRNEIGRETTEFYKKLYSDTD